MSATRRVFLDTETTGLEPAEDRIVEVAAIETELGLRTGREFHSVVNPERSVSFAATKVHGLHNDVLREAPKFNEIASKLIAFVQGAELVMHNAEFDVGFLDEELRRCGYNERVESICEVVDSLELAKQMFPGKSNSLGALCRRFQVPFDAASLHNAHTDASLLAAVYMKMRSSEATLDLVIEEPAATAEADAGSKSRLTKNPRQSIVINATPEERTEHERYMKRLKLEADSL